MNIEYNLNGTLTISAIIEGFRVQRTYIGYTKRQAMELFKNEFKGRL